ncbi:BspA family leucine-rich repeat surface protein [Peredibacter sp. HCB2-198]|uniref:BspA family leucine-rich repeat surface protein n=1 Tax=Peredibacter sp. HCB2-198 TaxID=3383025 RepID=UPI0038B5A7A0
MRRFLLFILILLTTTGCFNHIRATFKDHFTNNSNIPPVGSPSIVAVSDKIVFKDKPITIDVNDSNTNGDVDSDGDTITYSCFYDTTVDAVVTNTNSCTLLPGLSFNTSTGLLSWTPDGSQVGNYEIKIIAIGGNSADEEIFKLEVRPPPPFISKWETTGPNETITLPLRAGYNYNMQVDWGDGSPDSTITSDTDPDKTHNYVTPGIYTVTITGLAEAWFFDYDSESSKIIEVVELGSMGWKNLESAFAGCDNLTSFAGGDTSEVTNMSFMFADNSSLTTIDLSTFNTSQVTTMRSMFEWSAPTSLDLSSFDTSSVTNMRDMFAGAGVTTLNLSNFNTSAVTNMSRMFVYCYSLTSLNISNFNTSAVTDMSQMFYADGVLTSVDVSNFDTSAVTNMYGMFSGTINLTSINLSNFNTAAVTRMDYMFDYSGATSLDLSNFITSSVTTMQGMFWGSRVANLDLSNFNTSVVTNMESMLRDTPNLTSVNLSSFNTSSVTTMNSMFQNATSLSSLNLSNFNTANVQNMVSMFNGTSNLTSLNATNWDVSGVFFYGNIWNATNPGLQVICNQGGSPGTGDLFGEPCN